MVIDGQIRERLNNGQLTVYSQKSERGAKQTKEVTKVNNSEQLENVNHQSKNVLRGGQVTPIKQK